MEFSEETNLEKDQDNDYERLNKMEVIHFYSHTPKKSSSKKTKYIFITFIILIILVLIFSCVYYFHFYRKNFSKNYRTVTYNKKEQEKGNKNGQAKKVEKIETKKTVKNKQKNVQPKQKVPVKEPPKKIQPPKIIPKKPGIAFLYPRITEYMITTAEYFLKLKIYSLFFLVQGHNQADNDLKFSKNITRINAYYDHNLIGKAVKNQNIKYIIMNDAYSKNEVKWLKSIGVKIIGVFDDVFISNDVKNARNLNNMLGYDAFIQDCPYDYGMYKKKKITTNIFIPNIYDTRKAKLSSLNNHNILLLGRLNDKENGVMTAITAMSSIVKEFPDTKLNIISPDGQTLKINQLIKKYELNKNINFLPFDSKISYYCSDSSIFVYTSLIEDCKTAIKEAMSRGIPCIISDKIVKNLFFKDGMISVNITKEKALLNEITKLLKDNKYKNKMGMGAKLNLDKINDDAVSIWEKLFTSLNNGQKDFRKLRNEIEIKYTQKKKENKIVRKAAPTSKAEVKKKVQVTPHKKIIKINKAPAVQPKKIIKKKKQEPTK